MKPCETSLKCDLCQEDAYYCDSVPDSSVPGITPAECGYRLQPLCWVHGRERKKDKTSRVQMLMRCIRQGLARLDRDRSSGDVECSQCHKKYYDHPHDADHPYMNVLCDGSAVKL